MPACCHSRRRRQHVIPQPHPSASGRSCHACLEDEENASEDRAIRNTWAASLGSRACRKERFEGRPKVVGDSRNMHPASLRVLHYCSALLVARRLMYRRTRGHRRRAGPRWSKPGRVDSGVVGSLAAITTHGALLMPDSRPACPAAGTLATQVHMAATRLSVAPAGPLMQSGKRRVTGPLTWW